MQKTKATAGWKLKVAALLLGSTLACYLLWIVGNNIRIGDQTLTQKLVLKAWFARVSWFGNPSIGITAPDTLLGWRHKPGSVGRHYLPYSFNVRYHIDKQGNRATKASYELPKILFVGCSYTFGHGVEDDSIFVARLQGQLPEYKLVNTAVNAYGTGQAFLTLLESLGRHDDIRLVVYPFINQHAHRNYRRKEWLDKLWNNRKLLNVRFEMESGRLVHRGLTDPLKDAISDSLLLEKKEAEVSQALIRAMSDTCAALGIPFLLVHLPDWRPAGLDTLLAPLADTARYLDLKQKIDIRAAALPMDLHPNAACHRLMAMELLPFLKKNIWKSQAGRGVPVKSRAVN